MNNEFFYTHEVIRQWFSLMTSSLMKIIAKSPHSWQQKVVIHCNSSIILYVIMDTELGPMEYNIR